jgi:hypothetical protein
MRKSVVSNLPPTPRLFAPALPPSLLQGILIQQFFGELFSILVFGLPVFFFPFCKDVLFV